MTVLSGYDIVTEIRASLIADLLEANLDLPGLGRVRTPFEYALTRTTDGLTIGLQVIVPALDVDLQSNRPLAIELQFAQSSVSALDLVISPLDGVLRVEFDHRIDVQDGAAVLLIQARPGSAAVTYSNSSLGAMDLALHGTDIAPELFRIATDMAIAQLAIDMGEIPLALGIPVTPEVDGSIMPRLAYSGLEAFPWGDADRAGQAMVLAGFLFAANVGHGNAGGKDQLALPADQMVAVSMSPQAFRRFCFCPSLMEGLMPSSIKVPGIGSIPLGQEYLNGRWARLPSACASAEEFEVQDGLKLTKVADTLGDGRIILDLEFYTKGFCYKASGSVRAYLSFAIEGNMLVPSAWNDEPDVGVSIPWYCWIAAWVVGKIYAVAALGIANIVATLAADGIADGLVASALADNLTSMNAGQATAGPLAVTLERSEIKPDRFTLSGDAAVNFAGQRGRVAISLQGGAGTSEIVSAKSGEWTTRIPCEAKEDTFRYVVSQQIVPYQYAVVTSMLPALRCQFVLRFHTSAGQHEAILDRARNSVTVENVQVDFPLPLTTGGTKMTKSVTINYTIANQTIRFSNRPEDGNYSIDLLVRDFRDYLGNKVQVPVTVLYAGIHVDGHLLWIDGNYQQRVFDCILKGYREAMKDPDIREGVIIRDDGFEPINPGDPAPRIRDMFERLTFSGLPQSQLMPWLAQLATAGSSAAARAPNERKLAGKSVQSRVEAIRRQTAADLAQAIQEVGKGAGRRL